jgi:hypothetical protein
MRIDEYLLKHTTIGIVIALALVIGVGTGGGLAETTATVTTRSIFNATQEIRSACSYIVSNYENSTGLVAETPSLERFFLYSDNFLATLVLSNGCGNPSLAQSVNHTLSRYDASRFPNQYMAFECEGPFFEGSEDYHISGDVWTTVNNKSGTPLNDSYADIAFLQAYYDKECSKNVPAAIAAFDAGASEYNGIGFTDMAFQTGQSAGVYQTYKLALYIYTAELLNQTAPLSAVVNMVRMQNSTTGGFYTGYDALLTPIGTTNTETTCLSVMALVDAFGHTRAPESSTSVSLTFIAWVWAVAVVATVIALIVLATRVSNRSGDGEPSTTKGSPESLPERAGDWSAKLD